MKLGKTIRKDTSKIILLFFAIVIFSTGCTVKVPMNPIVGAIEIKEKLSVEAGLLITEETKNYIYKGHPKSFTMSARPHEFHLGDSLEKASIQAFSQVFRKITLVRTNEEAKKYKIVIEPRIEDFHFRYDALSSAGFAVALLSKIKVRVTLSSREALVWQKSIESPEQKKGPWAINTYYDTYMGEAASDALIFTLRKLAVDISEDEAIRKFIEKPER